MRLRFAGERQLQRAADSFFRQMQSEAPDDHDDDGEDEQFLTLDSSDDGGSAIFTVVPASSLRALLPGTATTATPASTRPQQTGRERSHIFLEQDSSVSSCSEGSHRPEKDCAKGNDAATTGQAASPWRTLVRGFSTVSDAVSRYMQRWSAAGNGSSSDTEPQAQRRQTPEESPAVDHRPASAAVDAERLLDLRSEPADLSEGEPHGSSSAGGSQSDYFAQENAQEAANRALQITRAMRRAAYPRSSRRSRKQYDTAGNRLAAKLSLALGERVSGVWDGGPVANGGQYLHRCPRLGGEAIMPPSTPDSNDGLFVGVPESCWPYPALRLKPCCS